MVGDGPGKNLPAGKYCPRQGTFFPLVSLPPTRITGAGMAEKCLTGGEERAENPNIYAQTGLGRKREKRISKGLLVSTSVSVQPARG